MKKARVCLTDGSTATMDSIGIHNEGTPNQQSYFEIVAPKTSNIGIELQSGESTIFYDGRCGEVLNAMEKTVTPCIPVEPGSVLGVSIWSVLKEDTKRRNLVTFSLNGKEINELPFRLEGNKISPTIYVENETSDVVVNIDGQSCEYNPGNV